MTLDAALTFLRANADALRLQASGYSPTSTSKVRAGLLAQADALDAYAAALEAAPAPDPAAVPSVLLLLI